MVGKCKITQLQQCSISIISMAVWQQAGHVKIYVFLSKRPARKEPSQVLVLMIEYLVAVSFKLWMMCHALCFGL